MALTLRTTKGSILTYAEMDANLTGLSNGSNWAVLVTATALTLSGALTAGSVSAATVSGTTSISSPTISATTKFLAGDGSAAVPSYAFSAQPGTGFFRSGTNQLWAASAGVPQFGIANAGGLGLLSTGLISWQPDATTSGDLFLARDAANTLAQRNGTTAQAFNLYNTYTDASNYERMLIRYSGNVAEIRSDALGTGVIRPLRLVGEAGSAVIDLKNAVDSIVLTPVAGGTVSLGSDNTYDLGRAAAGRPRAGYFGTSVIVGGALQSTVKVIGDTAADKAPVLSLFRTGSREGFIAQTTNGFVFGNSSGLANYQDATLDAGAQWRITATGHWQAITDNTYDLGATGANRPRTGYFGTSVITPLLDSTGAVKAFSGTAIPAGGTAGAGLLVSSTANFGVFFGSGVPTLSAAQGSLYLRSDGSSTSTRLYINTNGTTGWTNVTTAT